MQESPTAEHKMILGLIYTKFLLELNSNQYKSLIMKKSPLDEENK
jgi:hypothetical protein